jgi:drug/metabolite transporter (DMT)-like permease
MTPQSEPRADRAELVLRTSRRALVVVLAAVLLVAATLIAHALRPGSLLADWSSKVPWLFPVAMVAVFVILNAPLLRRQLRPDSPEMRAMLEDEFRHANLARAQRLALIVVLVAQVPLAILVSGLATEPAVTVMAVASVTLAMTTLIASFLFFDRE